MQQRPRFGIEFLAHQFGEREPVGRRRGDGAEAQPLGGRGRGVADGKDRPAALIACLGERARAIGTGQQDCLGSREGCGEPRRWPQDLQMEQRCDHRHMAALA
jgi:hypothetical protein